MLVILCNLIVIDPEQIAIELGNSLTGTWTYTHFPVTDKGSSFRVYNVCMYTCACFYLMFAFL